MSDAAAGLQAMGAARENEIDLLREQNDELRDQVQILRALIEVLNEEKEELSEQLNLELQAHNHEPWWA
jgi:SMC interacting uncharacterized protein involved in chromosome segregation